MKRILIVDDDEDALDTFQIMLEIGGYQVSPLKNVNDVIERITLFKPSLIILDLVLNTFDLKALCAKVKQNPLSHKIPLLMMCGVSSAKEIAAIICPHDDFMQRPFKLELLFQKIETLLKRSNGVAI